MYSNNMVSYLLAGALLVLLSPRATAVQVSVGEETILVPVPAGFAEVSEVSKEEFAFFSDILPETNRLHAAFISEGDTGLLMKGKEAELDQYFIVHSGKTMAELTLSKTDFGVLRTILRNEFADMAATIQENGDAISEVTTRAGEAFSKRFGAETALNISGASTLGIDEESASHIMTSGLLKYNFRVEEKSTEHVSAGTMIFALINGKVLQLGVYRTYESHEDIEWTRSEAKKWLSLILAANQRTWPLADGEIVPQGTLLATHIEKLIAGDQAEFRTLGHTKSHGVDVSLRYPASWTASEGIRPHIVQNFRGQAALGITPSCTILVQEMPIWASFFLRGDTGAETLSEMSLEMVPAEAIIIDSKQTKLDAEPATWLKYYYTQERAGLDVSLYCLQYVLFYDGNMIAVQCAVSGSANNKELLEDSFLTHLPLFQNIGTSLVLHSKWNEADSSLMKVMFELLWLVPLLLLTILSLGIALLPLTNTRSTASRCQKERHQHEADARRMKQEKVQWEEIAKKAREDAQRAQNEARDQEEAARNRSHKTPEPQASRNEEYYAKVLGLSGRMTHDEVRKRYHALASKYHPDRVHHLGEKLRQVADREMREINEAFDYFKRRYGI